MVGDFKPAPRKKGGAKKKGATAVKPPVARVASPCWSGFAAGLALGLLVAGLVYLNLRVGQTSGERVEIPREPVEQAEGRFQFYTLLPEMEVVVPEPEPEPAPPPKGGDGETPSAPPAVAKVTRPGTYVLQAGSFRRHQDAERRKAELALLGVYSTVQAVTLDNGETWYRVRIGPFEQLDELNEARALLQENGVDTLLVRLKRG